MMNTLEITLIAIGLAMDCLAVSISSAVTIKDIKLSDGVRVGIFFGAFQGGMAFIGWLGASSFASLVESVDHWIAFFLLAIIGIKMIKEGLEGEESSGMNHRNMKVLLLLSVATSIDSLAIGVSFAFLGISIIMPVIMICVMSFIFAFAGTFIGKKAGDMLGGRMEIIGGLILIGLGVKILLEHTVL